MAEIAKVIATGKCILFMGAGVHYPPPGPSPYCYPEEKRPPLGGALSDDLASECDFKREFPKHSTSNLQRVSLHYELKNGRHNLVKRIETAVNENKAPSPILHALAGLNFPLVATTNYDRLFEAALYAAHKEPVICVYNKDRHVPTLDYPQAEPDAMKPFLFKVHGSIEAAKSIVITDEDYIDFVMRMSDKGEFNPVPATFLYYLKKWPTLFLGYSLMDYNLRLLFKTIRWMGDPAEIPRTYSVDVRPDQLIYKIYSEPKGFVRFIVQDVWAFVPELYRRVKHKRMPL